MNALLLIDIQNDYFPGGALPLVGAESAAQCAAQLLAAFRAADKPVMHIQHIAQRPGATFFLPDSHGAQIHPSVAPQPGERVFVKHYPNSFRQTGLLAALRERDIKHLTMAGMMTHMCVDSTVRAAADLEFSCDLAHDACATRDLTFAGQRIAATAVQTAYLAALSGLFARVVSVTTLSVNGV